MEDPTKLDSSGSEHKTEIKGNTTGGGRTGNFVAGTVLAKRYRIVGLLGKGGMGEVYKAEDLDLDQTVALKFLPEELAKNDELLRRFRGEVRNARQVSHRNVCRVFDIGEIDGQHFLSMEYIDGDDLSMLLRRIGRLPSDKAVDISREICMGLAAIHKAGILHRDLKPANIIIDSKGEARITDFGIAGLEADVQGAEARVGTPAYMSPEQADGRELTKQSDIYSLGLLLYEIFTGKQAFEGDSIHELRIKHATTTPKDASEIVAGIDPLVEKVINRCLEKNPKDRPDSALRVAMSLPGGDPLQVALEAGETPTPEMVAAAPKEGALRPPVAVAMLAAVIVMLVAVVLVGGKRQLYNYVPFEKSPEVLRETARDIARRAGYNEPIDSSDWFTVRGDMLNYIAKNDQSPDRWEKMKAARPSAISFRYRQSPRYLETDDGRVDSDSPPRTVSGMIEASLDTRGQLRFFRAEPPQVVDSAATTPTEIDWSIFFTAAGLSQSEFRPAESKWTPRTTYDIRTAWEGAYPENPQMPIRIEAAGFNGKAVYFEIVNSWEQPVSEAATPMSTGRKAFFGLIIGLLLLAAIGGALLTIKNIRLGRGDRRGAFRLAHFAFWASVIRDVFWPTAHHVPTIAEFFVVMLPIIAWALLFAGFFWVLYMALEPFVRRRWPQRIISWTRLLAGDFRDPMVGRDLLISALIGVGVLLWESLRYQVPVWLGNPPGIPSGGVNWLGAGSFLSFLGNLSLNKLVNSIIILFVVLMLSLILRRDWLAFVIVWAFFVLIVFLGARDPSGVDLIFIAIGPAIFFFLPLWRYGLLVLVLSGLFSGLGQLPITTNFTAWYATGFVMYLALLVVLAVYGFYTSLAGQKPFGGKFLEE